MGARDPSTRDAIFNQTGAAAFWNGDLTWTLKPLCQRSEAGRRQKANKYVIVDVNEDVLKRTVPQRIIDQAVFVSHKAAEPPMTLHELARYAGVFSVLRSYSCDAKLLITSRLHAAMPSAAMGVPVVLIDDPATLPGGGGAQGEARLAGLEDVVHVMRPEDAVEGGAATTFDWDNPPPNPKANMRRKHAGMSHVSLACHDEKFLDAGVKFGALDPWFSALAAEEPPPCEAQSQPDAAAVAAAAERVHIVTGVDLNYMKNLNGVAVATWARALGKSAPKFQPVALYVLTDRQGEGGVVGPFTFIYTPCLSLNSPVLSLSPHVTRTNTVLPLQLSLNSSEIRRWCECERPLRVGCRRRIGACSEL